MTCRSGGWRCFWRGGKGALAPCPPFFFQSHENGGHASLCPPYEINLALRRLLLRRRRRLALGTGTAGDANLVAVGNTIRRGSDHAVVGCDARGEFNLLAEIAC